MKNGGPNQLFGLWRPPARVVRVHFHTGEVDTIALLRGTEIYISEKFRGFMNRPFGFRAFAAAGPSRLYLGDNDSYAVSSYTQQGVYRYSIERQSRPTDVTKADIDETAKRLLNLELDPRDRHLFALLLSEVPYRQQVPAYQQMIADQGDNLWIEDFDRGGEKYSWWNVYDTLGHSIARLHTPKGFEISEIGSDYVLGFVRAGGIQLLQLHTLRKPRSEE